MITAKDRLARELRDMIRNGRYALGDKIPTERELAQQSGLSRVTVRRALSQLETEKLIVRRQGLGAFVANPRHPQGPATGAALIAMLIFGRTNYFSHISRHAPAHASARGYTMAIGLNGNPVEEHEFINAFIRSGVKGVIMTPRSYSDPGYAALVKNNIPVVFLTLLLPGQVEDSVITENALGASLATRHLIELGHRRIGYVGLPATADPPIPLQRRRGCLDTLREAGLAPPDEWVIDLDNDGAWQGRLTRVLQSRPRPTALVTYSDAAAALVMGEAARLGLRTPEDLSVTGFDDEPAVQTGGPFTTLNPEYSHVAAEAVAMLVDKIENPAPRPKQTRAVHPRLVIGRTTAPPPPDPA